MTIREALLPNTPKLNAKMLAIEKVCMELGVKVEHSYDMAGTTCVSTSSKPTTKSENSSTTEK